MYNIKKYYVSMHSNPKDSPSTAGHSEFILLGAPFDVCRCSVDPEQYESGLPDKPSGFRVGLFLPDIGIPILRASNNAIGVGCPINGCNEFVVLDR